MPHSEPTPQVKAAQDSLQLAGRLLGLVGFLTVGVIVVAVFGGLALDKWLGTRPLFVVLFIVGSFPLSLYIIYRAALDTVARVKPVALAPRSKEDENSDDNNA